MEWLIQPAPVRAVSYPLARLVVPLYFGSSAPGPEVTKEAGWLDTGAPISIVPFHVHHRRLTWHPIPGVQATWFGQRCDLERSRAALSLGGPESQQKLTESSAASS